MSASIIPEPSKANASPPVPTPVSGSAAVAADATASDATASDAIVEQIIAEFEPIIAAQRRVLAQVWQDRSISKLNLHLLMLLDSHGPQRMGRLAALASISLPNLTGIVSRMEEHGLVERVRDERDRRLVVVRSTSKGQSSCEQFESLRRQELRRILLALSANERLCCLEAISAMGRAASRLAPEPTGA